MARKIDCECGFTVRGEDDEQLLAAAREHVQSDHPEMVDKVSDEQLLSMAVDE